MNVQQAIDKAVSEDKRITFAHEGGRDAVLAAVVDSKGCALMSPNEDCAQVTVWPPSQCFDRIEGGVAWKTPYIFKSSAE